MWIKVIFLVVILLSIQNRADCCKKFETALANVIATNEPKSSGDVGKSQIVLGKDRLLIQGNLDLKWLYAKVTKDIDWNQLISNMFENLAAIFDSRRHFKNILIRILSDIRMRCNESKLKCFLGTIQDAARYAQKTKRLVVIYIEDGDYRSPSPSSSFFRTALSDPAIGSLLNDEFVFFAGSTRHGSTKKIARDLNARKYVDFPLFAVVNPNSIFDESSNLTNPDATPELLTKLKLPQAEIASGKIARFLQRSIFIILCFYDTLTLL